MNEVYDYDDLRRAHQLVELIMEGGSGTNEFDRAALLLARYVRANLDLSDEVDGRA